jgi:two-component system NtrC family sensor kinase
LRLSIATRIFLGFAAVLTVFGAVSTFAVWRMHGIGEEIRLVSEAYLPLTKVAAQLESFHKNKQRDTDKLLEEAEPRYQKILIKSARLYFPRIVRELLTQGKALAVRARELGGPSEAEFVDGVEQRLTRLSQEYEVYDAADDALSSAMDTEGPRSAAVIDERGGELKRVGRRIEQELKQLSLTMEARIQQRVREAQGQERTSSWAIVGLSLAAILIGLLATILSQKLLAPIRTLTQAAVRIGRGDYDAKVPTEAADEVGVLAREFNQMAASLAARERELGEKQEALVRAEKLATIGRVAAQITHEIRNPLSSIGLNAELLAEEIRGEDEVAREGRRLCGAIAHEVERLGEITEDYLRLARLPAPDLAPRDVSRLVRDLVDFVRPELEAAGVEVQLDLPDAPAQVWAGEGPLPARVDEAQLRQALLNLVRNAREAMPGGGRLTIAARRAATGVRLVVKDTGVGMPPEAAARIFEPFFTTKEQGTGLGLSLTQQIVAQHGGSLTCDTAPGAGTTFTLDLPGVEAA